MTSRKQPKNGRKPAPKVDRAPSPATEGSVPEPHLDPDQHPIAAKLTLIQQQVCGWVTFNHPKLNEAGNAVGRDAIAFDVGSGMTEYRLETWREFTLEMIGQLIGGGEVIVMCYRGNGQILTN